MLYRSCTQCMTFLWGVHFLFHNNVKYDFSSVISVCNRSIPIRFYHALYYLHCSQSAVEYSKDFVTSIVVGKDVVPRIGLHQMETLRHDLMNALTKSKDSKVINRVKFINVSRKNLNFYNYDWTRKEIIIL